MSNRAQFIKGFATFNGTSLVEAEHTWLLYSVGLEPWERTQAEEMGYAMGYASAELYAHIFRDSGAQERYTKTILRFPSA